MKLRGCRRAASLAVAAAALAFLSVGSHQARAAGDAQKAEPSATLPLPPDPEPAPVPLGQPPAESAAPAVFGPADTLGPPANPPEMQTGLVTGDALGGFARDELRDAVSPLDFGVALGASVWFAGPVGGKHSALSATALIGYTFAEKNRQARVRFRLGAILQYSALRETGETDTFVDVLIDPTMRVRVWQQRLYVSADVGVGVLALGGLKRTSVFLVPNEEGMISSSQSLAELRPGVTATFRIYPAVELFAGPALAVNPKKPHFNQAIVRLELLAGAALRF